LRPALTLNPIEPVLDVVHDGLALDSTLARVQVFDQFPLELAIVGVRQELIVVKQDLSLELQVSCLQGTELVLQHIHVIPMNLQEIEGEYLDL
jgi:hypothetical protein